MIPCIVFTEQREAKAATARGVFQIAEHIEGVVEEATSALEQQSLASGEINLAIEDINRVAMERSEAMDQSGGAGQAVLELSSQARVLKNLIMEMRDKDGQADLARSQGTPRQ